MKASRRFDFDNYGNDSDDGFGGDPFLDPHPGHSTCSRPKRSVTLGDFFAPGLLTPAAADDGFNDDVDEEDIMDEEPWAEEEDYYENDIAEISRCFAELDKKYNYSKCDREELTRALREYNYNLDEFVKAALEGDFGPFYKKKAKNTVQNQGPTPQSRQGNSQIIKSFSVMSINQMSKQHRSCKRTPEMVRQVIAAGKKRINLVIVGHVDAGKSTLMGHLLLLNGNIVESEFRKTKNKSEKDGHPENMYANLMTNDESEQEHGVTIDVAMTEFQTNNLIVTILDAPGHKDFVPNMIAGASQADAALLVVDVTNPLFDRGQAREHLLLCRSLGVSSLIVAINKMDSINYDQHYFNETKEKVQNFLKSLQWSALNIIPTAALKSDNLKNLSQNMPWYTGPTVIQAIDELKPPSYDIDAPFLLCISECIDRNNLVVATGRIECGYVCPSDNLILLPSDRYVQVKNVKVNDKDVLFASAGTICSLYCHIQLGPQGSEYIQIGSALCSPERTLQVATNFHARIATFSMQVPLLKGASLVFHRHAIDIPLQIVSFLATINKKTKQPEKTNPTFICSNSMADVHFRLKSPIPLVVHSESKSFGRFIIRAGGETLGFGSITKIIPMSEQKKGKSQETQKTGESSILVHDD